MLTAAFLFAAANAVAKALYMRGHTLVSVFLARCLVVYLVNGAIVACREGGACARRVLLLRTGRRHSTQLAALRGLVGAATGLGLNLSFVFLTLADAFTVFKGVDLLGTCALGRLALGEEPSRRELGSGLLTLLGLLPCGKQGPFGRPAYLRQASWPRLAGPRSYPGILWRW